MTQLTAHSLRSTSSPQALSRSAAIGAAALASRQRELPDTMASDRFERLYQACIEGAPTTPDSHEQWSLTLSGARRSWK